MIRFTSLQWSVTPMVAAAIIASTIAPGWAFSQQMLGPGENGNYNFNYSDPDHHGATSQGTRPDPNSPGFHFSIEQGQGPFSGFQNGNRSFGNGGDPTDPRYYIQPPGNGD